jgi:hypothetical protein
MLKLAEPTLDAQWKAEKLPCLESKSGKRNQMKFVDLEPGMTPSLSPLNIGPEQLCCSH